MQTMNYKEAAEFLKITEGTLRNWVSKGRIAPHKVGKHVLFFREELETWITKPAAPIDPPAAPPKPAPAEVKPQVPSPAWDGRFQLSFSGKGDGAPFALLENLPSEAVKMTPDEMRELARYLVEAATMCEDPSYRGVKHFRVLRESARNLSMPCLIPHDFIRDLKALSLAAVRTNDPKATTPEKYILRFIREGLQNQEPIINSRLKERGNRSINFVSIR